MKALDTNILVRLLTGDDSTQLKKVLTLLRAAEQKGERFYIDKTVVLELLWVLETVYNYSREEILSALGRLLDLPLFSFENAEMLQQFTSWATLSRADFSDLFIGLSAKSSQCETTLTFDRKAAKEQKLFHLL